MSALVGLLFLYSVGITIGLIVSVQSNNELKTKVRFLEKRIQELMLQLQGKLTPGAAPATPASQAAVQPVATAPQVAAPVATPAPVQIPTYTPAPKVKDKSSGLGAVGVSFAVGVLLMVIAAAVFISATWQTMPAGAKCLVLALVVSVVYALCAFTNKKLKLTKTSSVLYMLGSLISPLAVVVGFLAFEFKETPIILSCCALTLGVTGFIGYKIFGSKLQVAISYIGFVWVDIFICMEALGNLEGFVLGSCVAAFVSGLIYFIKPDLKYFNYFAEFTAYGAVIGFFMSAGIGKALLPCAIVSWVLYWAAILMLTKKRTWLKYISAIVPVYAVCLLPINQIVRERADLLIVATLATALMFAVYKLLKQDNPSANAVITFVMGILIYIAAFCEDKESWVHIVGLAVPVFIMIAVIALSRFKAERIVYTYAALITLLPFIGDIGRRGYNPYIFIAIFIAMLLAGFKFRNIHLPIAASAVFVMSYFAEIFTLHEDEIDIHIMMFAGLSLAIYAAIVFINKFKPFEKSLQYSFRFSTLALLIVTHLVLLIRVFKGNVGVIVAAIVIDALFTLVTLYDKDNYFGVIPAFSALCTLVYLFADNNINLWLAGAIILIVFVLIGRIFICERFARKGRIDWLSIMAGFACFLPIEGFYKTTLLLTLYALTFIGRFSSADSVEEKVKAHLKEILSAAVALFAISFAVTDVKMSESVDVEARLLAIVIGAAVITFIIKPFKRVKWIWFSVVAFCLQVEAIHAADAGTLIPLTLVTIFGVGIFIFSFIAKRRSWFILAISIIAEFGIILAITFWESKLWWIYLLVLGGILIATASFNEYKRRQAIESGLEDKKIRLFDSWTW